MPLWQLQIRGTCLMKCKLTPQLSSDDWKDFCSRFHFSPADLPYIKAIYTALLPLVESCAYYSLDQNLDGIFLPHYAYGFVTLGNGIDELSELYLNHEQIQEAYIVDCVSLLLLSKAYIPAPARPRCPRAATRQRLRPRICHSPAQRGTAPPEARQDTPRHTRRNIEWQ